MTGVAQSFSDAVEAYRRYLQDAGLVVPSLRIESQVESTRDWSRASTIAEVKAWFEHQRAACPMNVSSIPLNKMRGWAVDPVTGDVRHESGEFFTVHGIRVTQSEDREVGGGWDQPILEQVGFDGGLLGLLRKRIDGVPHYLIEAKAEPGNYKTIQMSPTLQATFSNLKRAHKGRKPRFAELFEEPEDHGATVLYSQWLSEDGGRLHLKRNRGMLVEIPENTHVDAPESFMWMSMWQIKECLKEDAWVNPHVRGIIAHL